MPTSQFFSSLYSSIQPCTLLPSSPLFFLLALSRASPSILPFLPFHITHDGLPFPPKCQQMQMFIILVNTFDNSCEQLKGLQKRRMKLHLATEGTIMTCFSLFSAEEKVECLFLSLSMFHQKRLINWIFSKQLDVLFTSFWSNTLEIVMNLSPSAIEQTESFCVKPKKLQRFS